MQTQALGGEVFADNRHAEVRAIAAAVALRQRVAQQARLVGAAAHLGEQVLPVLARHTTIFEIRAGVFTAVVEEAHIVVLLFERLDLGVDEVIDFAEDLLDVLGDVEVHGRFLPTVRRCSSLGGDGSSGSLVRAGDADLVQHCLEQVAHQLLFGFMVELAVANS